MSHLILVFEADEDCVDPNDAAKMPRRHAEVVSLDQDVIVMWREYGDQFKDGVRTHIVGGGVFANVTVRAAKKALRRLTSL